MWRHRGALWWHLHCLDIGSKVRLVTSVAASSGPLGRRQSFAAEDAGAPEDFSAAHMALLLATQQAVALVAEKHLLMTSILRGACHPRQGHRFRLTAQASRGLGTLGANLTQASACLGVLRFCLRCLALLALAPLRTIFRAVLLTLVRRQSSGTGRAIAASARLLLPALSPLPILHSSPALLVSATTGVTTGHPRQRTLRHQRKQPSHEVTNV